MTSLMLGKLRALMFYARALLESCGLIESVHKISGRRAEIC